MARQRVLVPYNFTIHDQKAIDFIIRTFLAVKDIQFTLFHAYAPLPEIQTGSNAVLGRLQGTMTSLSEELRGQERYLKEGREELLKKGFSDDQVDYIFKAREKDVTNEIAETAIKGGYQMVLLSRNPTKTTRLFGRNVSSKLLATLKNTTICIVN